jgi:hypothetical protein
MARLRWPGILRTPEIAGHRLRRERGLRVAAAAKDLDTVRSEEVPLRLMGFGTGSELGSWRRRAAGWCGLDAGLPSYCCCCRSGRRTAAQAGGGRAASAAWCRGREAEARGRSAGQCGPRQVTLWRVGLYVHTHSVLYLSHVRMARGDRRRVECPPGACCRVGRGPIRGQTYGAARAPGGVQVWVTYGGGAYH